MVCQKVLKEAESKYGAAWAIAVVQDVQSGEIRALADSDEVQAGTDAAKMSPSRAVSETFEPGSVGKVISMSGYLQMGLHKMSDQLSVPDHITQEARPTRTHSTMALSAGRSPAFCRTHRTSA